MDRDVPQGVSYWTGVWDPSREALSNEVATLRAALCPGATVVSVSHGQRGSIDVGRRVITLPGHRWMMLRTLAAALERRAAVTHIFGEMHAWHLARAVGRRPLLFTVAIPGEPLPAALLDKVSLFAAESEPLADQLRHAGVDSQRIRIIYPGIDLSRFRPTPRASGGRFSIVFASTPPSASEFDARGIATLIEAARLCPEVDVRLMWRQWGDTAALRAALDDLRPPANVISEWRDVADMSEVYRAADAVAFLPLHAHGKSCPNSVIEALACGRPALVSPSCGISRLIGDEGAGFVVSRNPADVAEALRALARQQTVRGRSARALAERHFDVTAFIAAYRDAYARIALELLPERLPPVGGGVRAVPGRKPS